MFVFVHLTLKLHQDEREEALAKLKSIEQKYNVLNVGLYPYPILMHQET